MKLNEYLTSGEAAEFLGVPVRTLIIWESAGKIFTHRNPITGHRLFKREALQAILDQVAGIAPKEVHGIATTIRSKKLKEADWGNRGNK